MYSVHKVKADFEPLQDLCVLICVMVASQAQNSHGDKAARTLERDSGVLTLYVNTITELYF